MQYQDISKEYVEMPEIASPRFRDVLGFEAKSAHVLCALLLGVPNRPANARYVTLLESRTTFLPSANHSMFCCQELWRTVHSPTNIKTSSSLLMFSRSFCLNWIATSQIVSFTLFNSSHVVPLCCYPLLRRFIRPRCSCSIDSRPSSFQHWHRHRCLWPLEQCSRRAHHQINPETGSNN